MHASQRSLLKITMMTQDEYLSSGVPKPITTLTLEQDLQMRVLFDAISQNEPDRDDLNTLIMSLQHQNYVLSNSMMNLVKKWPTTNPTPKDQTITKEVKPRFGTLFGITI